MYIVPMYSHQVPLKETIRKIFLDVSGNHTSYGTDVAVLQDENDKLVKKPKKINCFTRLARRKIGPVGNNEVFKQI